MKSQMASRLVGTQLAERFRACSGVPTGAGSRSAINCLRSPAQSRVHKRPRSPEEHLGNKEWLTVLHPNPHGAGVALLSVSFDFDGTLTESDIRNPKDHLRKVSIGDRRYGFRRDIECLIVFVN